MNDSDRRCAHCGAAVPAAAPEGLCPRCLLQRVAEPTDSGLNEPESDAALPLPAPSLEALASAFPNLEILRCVGRGGMGVVYEARQKSLDRRVALKLLAPQRATDTQFAARFAQEARALAALSHPHIVTIHDFGQAGGFYFLLMEFVDGPNLRQLLRARRLSPEEALAIVPPLCDALQFAHEHGIVHRDIKPENLLLDAKARIKIADFGIARMLDSRTAPAAVAGQFSGLAGTPGYMAPEQRSSPDRIDSRADIYSLGVVVYEMLTGELPTDRLVPPSSKVQVDVRLDQIVLRALATNPELRYQTAHDFRSELETLTRDDSSRPSSTPTVVPPPLLAPAVPQGSSILPSVTPGTRLPSPPTSNAAPPSPPPAAPDRLRVLRALLPFRRPGRIRVGAAVLLGLVALGLGVMRLRVTRLDQQLNAAHWSERAARGQASLVLATNQELAARSGLWTPAAGDPRSVGDAPGTPQSQADRARAKQVREAQDKVQQTREQLEISRKRLASARTFGEEQWTRAWLPTLPLWLAGMALLVVFRRPPGEARGQSPRSTSMRPRLPAALIIGGALLVTLLSSRWMDQSYARSPEAFADLFASPSSPPLKRLGWTGIGVSNNVLWVDVETELERWSAEARWEFSGPALPAETEGVVEDQFAPRPSGLLVKPGQEEGNALWTIHSPGRHVTRLGFVFPDSEIAQAAFETLQPHPFAPLQTNDVLGGTLLHVFPSATHEYRASFRITTLFHSGDPTYVTTSRFGAWNEQGLDFHWIVTAARPGSIQVTQGEYRESAALRPGPPSSLPSSRVHLQIARLPGDRVRITRGVGETSSQIEQAGDYRSLAEEVLRTASLSTKTRRDTNTRLCLVQGRPLLARVTEVPSPPGADRVAPRSPSQPAGGIPLLPFVALVFFGIPGAISVWVFRRWRRGVSLVLPLVIGAILVVGLGLALLACLAIG